MKWRYKTVLPFILVCSSLAFGLGSLNSGANNNDEFLPVEEAFELSVARTADGATQLTWRIAPGYYLYQQQLTFSELDEDFHPALPVAMPYSDKFFGNMQVYRDSLQLTISPQHSGTFTLGWQGCADAGLCYPPQYRDIGSDSAASQTGSQSTQYASSAQTLAEDQRAVSLDGVKLVRSDVTTSSAESRELLSRYAIHGPPTLLWFGPDGQERRAHRITGEVNANEFLQRWQAANEEG